MVRDGNHPTFFCTKSEGREEVLSVVQACLPALLFWLKIFIFLLAYIEFILYICLVELKIIEL